MAALHLRKYDVITSIYIISKGYCNTRVCPEKNGTRINDLFMHYINI